MPIPDSPALNRRQLLRSVGIAALALGALGATSACSSREVVTDGTAGGEGPITVVDQYDNTITFDTPVGRIVSVIIPVPSMIIGADQSTARNVGANKVAISLASAGMLGTMFPQFLQTPVVAGNDFVPNVEHILAQNPDVVIQWGDKGDDIVAPLRNAGLKVLLLKYGTQEDLEAWITIFGDLLGKKPEADDLLATMAADRAVVEKSARAHAARAPRAMYLYNAPEIKVGADNSYMDFWIRLAGGRNVAAGAGSGSSLAVTREQVLTWDPEVVILGNFEPTAPEDVYRDPTWAALSAVKNKRVYKAPLGGFSWDPPCNESNLMWLWVNSVFFPDERHDLRARIAETYRHLYAYDVTAADVDRVLHLPANSVSSDYDRLFRA
ncbi:ABC transporter substrate-binding protein [Gordonia alkaliphila]|uniref:ABC transporter substrate-binding protein n=1 Tax=Gordonia alkaliphila TaxID=1053547 RepID=A0ABP8ZAX1_9ACTN|nr:ABC transporter substrate-binding protein [Gordonia alkaliphila]MCK0438855.1 ABC transporter substrate-binding protein [Gordonia alkaliphila]